MRKKFSLKWKSSVQPRKQRKYRKNAPINIRRNFMSVNLIKELRKKYGKRNFPVRKGDGIKILSGEFKGRKGKIEMVDYSKLKVSVEGIFRSKKDGTKVGISFEPSNLQIYELNLEDKKRKQALERKVSVGKEKDFKAKPLPKSEKNESKQGNNKNEKIKRNKK